MNLTTIKKILARAEDAASPREQANAARKLQQYLDEEQISVDELREQLGLIDKVWIRLKGKNAWERNMGALVAAIILGTKKIPCRIEKVYISLLVPINKKDEILDRWEEYRDSWREQLDALQIAFCSKHRLFIPKDEDDDDKAESDPLSEEELDRIRAMMDSIEQIDYRKKLE